MWRIWRVYCGVTRGAKNARPVQGNHQDFNDENQLLSPSDCSKPCNQIVLYGTSDQNSLNTKASDSPHKSIGLKSSKCHSLYENKHVNYLPKPPDYKWGSDTHHKETCRQHLKKDAGRLCKRNGRLHMLLSYSVLQALGWGSVLAFSWTILKGHSLYHYSNQHCPTQYWSLQPESNVLFDNEPYDQLLKICENNESAKDQQVLHSSYSKSYDYNKIFNPDIDRSLFSYLYSVASTQPVIESNVKSKVQTSKRTVARKKTVSHQTDLETLTCEETAYSKCYSLKLKSDTHLYHPNNDLQQSFLSQNCEIPKIEPCVSDLSTETLEHSANNTENDDSQSKFETKNETKKSQETVTIEDCSESGISSAGSNDYKKIDPSKKGNKAEDVQKLIQRELDAIRAVQNEMNGFLQRDLGLSLIDTDPESALLHFQAGTWLGDPDATYNLALCLHMGKGVKQNYKLARKYYSQASKAGHSWATYNLAVLVSSGLGGSVDNDLAYSLLQTAAERDVIPAKEAIKAMQEEDDYDEDEDDYDLIDANRTGIIASGR